MPVHLQSDRDLCCLRTDLENIVEYISEKSRREMCRLIRVFAFPICHKGPLFDVYRPSKVGANELQAFDHSLPHYISSFIPVRLILQVSYAAITHIFELQACVCYDHNNRYK